MPQPDTRQANRTTRGGTKLAQSFCVVGGAGLLAGAGLALAAGEAIQIPSAGLIGGGLALGGGGLAYLGWRGLSRMRAIERIGAAIREFGRGTRESWALKVPDDDGAESAAWNTVCKELDRLTLEVVRSGEDESDEQDAGAGLAAGVLESLTMGVLVLDAQCATVYSNPAGRMMLGATAETLAEILTGERWLDELRTAVGVAAGSGVRTTIDVSHEESSSVLQALIRPIEAGGVQRAIVMLEDVSQRRMAQRAQTGFIAQATHELRTPLTNIRLYVEQAIEEGDSDVQLRARALNVINQEARRLERLVSDMLSVSEIEAGSLGIRCDEVRMDQFFEDLRRDFSAQAADRGVELEFDLPPKLPVIWADRDKLSMAVTNVLGNGLKYTPRDGRVKVVFAEEGAGVVITISDTGFGIPEEDQERVFEKFARARDQRISHIEGTGLGLPLAREVVRLHGGDITLESVVGEGSVFTLSFPDVALKDRAAA